MPDLTPFDPATIFLIWAVLQIPLYLVITFIASVRTAPKN